MQYCGNNRNDSIAIIEVYYFQYRPTLDHIVVPCNSLNPFIGTLDVPVTNCNNLARVSLSNVSTACSDIHY